MVCRATQDGWGMVESSDRMWSTGEGNSKPLQYSCLENPMNRLKVTGKKKRLLNEVCDASPRGRKQREREKDLKYQKLSLSCRSFTFLKVIHSQIPKHGVNAQTRADYTANKQTKKISFLPLYYLVFLTCFCTLF